MPDAIDEGRTALRAAPQTWSLNGQDYELTALPDRVTRNSVDVLQCDLKVAQGGPLVFDDRINLVGNIPVSTGDGIFILQREYTDSRVDAALREHRPFTVWMSDADFNALTQGRRNQLTATGATRERQGRVRDPLLALRRTLDHTARVSTNGWADPHLKRRPDGTFLGDTSTFFASTADDYINSLSVISWADAQGGGNVSFAVQNDGEIGVSTDRQSGASWLINEGFVSFDTSSIGDSDTIDSYTFTLSAEGTAEGDDHNTTCQARIHDWGASVTTADWIDGSTASNWTNLTLFADFDVGTWVQTDGTDNDFTSQGAESSVSKTGTTYLAIAMANMAGSEPGTNGTNSIGAYAAEATGTDDDPKLVVNHTPPATTRRYTLPLLGVG